MRRLLTSPRRAQVEAWYKSAQDGGFGGVLLTSHNLFASIQSGAGTPKATRDAAAARKKLEKAQREAEAAAAALAVAEAEARALPAAGGAGNPLLGGGASEPSAVLRGLREAAERSRRDAEGAQADAEAAQKRLEKLKRAAETVWERLQAADLLVRSHAASPLCAVSL